MDQSNRKNYVESERSFFAAIEDHFLSSSGSFTEKAHAFARFTPRQAVSYFLARNEIFKAIVNLHGSVLDFGIHRGSSFFTWLTLSTTYEPYNHIRKIVGFDSFDGFSELGDQDVGAEGSDFHLKRLGGMKIEDGFAEIQKAIALHDLNRPLGHVPKADVIKGALPASLATYLEEHPETIVALANFGLGLYQPTVEILKLIKPRLQAGSILAFEDLNQAMWPGETKALREVFAPDEISLSRLPFCPHVSWIVVRSSGRR